MGCMTAIMRLLWCFLNRMAAAMHTDANGTHETLPIVRRNDIVVRVKCVCDGSGRQRWSVSRSYLFLSWLCIERTEDKKATRAFATRSQQQKQPKRRRLLGNTHGEWVLNATNADCVGCYLINSVKTRWAYNPSQPLLTNWLHRFVGYNKQENSASHSKLRQNREYCWPHTIHANYTGNNFDCISSFSLLFCVVIQFATACSITLYLHAPKWSDTVFN